MARGSINTLDPIEVNGEDLEVCLCTQSRAEGLEFSAIHQSRIRQTVGEWYRSNPTDHIRQRKQDRANDTGLVQRSIGSIGGIVEADR
jgi:hypothetical protein